MIPFGSAALLTALAVQSPAADSLRLLTLRLSESALIVGTRARPIVVRDAIPEALRQEELAVARKLAAAYAAAWRDSFFVREVARFAAWPAERQAGKLWADSVRRAGIDTWARAGPSAAIAVWQRAAARSTAIADTAGTAAALGNIGAGFLAEGKLDSAEVYLHRALILAAGVGDVRVEANAVVTLANLDRDRRNLVRAREGYARALALHERIGDARGMAADYNNLGLLAQDVGALDEARRHLDAALALNRRDDRQEVAATNLVNLAGLASLAGDFGRAEALYRDALATWRAREMWTDAAAALHGLGQLELRRGDYRAARTALLEALAIYDRTGPLATALTVRRALAGALAAQGELQQSLEELRRSDLIADSARAPPAVRAGVALARADLAVQLNQAAEAERLYAQAEFLYRQAGDPAGEAEAQQGRGTLFLLKDDAARAQTLLEGAVRAQLAAGHERAAALTRMSLGRASLDRGDTAAARRHLAAAASDLERLGDPVATAAALGQRAALEAGAGLPLAAESLYRVALDHLADRTAPDVAWRLRAGLALALRAQGDAAGSARELRAALTELERPSRSIALPERRTAFLADKWDVYVQLALVERERGLSGAAFEASERLRAREMLELLGRGRVTAEPATAGLVAREQDLRRRIAELTGPHPLTTSRAAAREPEGEALRREGLARAQEAYAELLLEMRERAPRHAALVSAETATWREVARRLAPQEAFIEYLVSDSGSLAFVVTADSLAVVPLGARRRALALLVEFARGTLVRPSDGITDSLWRAPLRQLGDQLIGRVEQTGLLAGKTRLVLVPHADLHYLPFAALLDSTGRFLIERYELTFTPSASVWLALGVRPTARDGGGLALAPRIDALPASRREVTAVARLAGADVLSGRDATEAAFRRDAPGRRVLHLATFGVLNKHNPLFSFVELAPGDGHDGRLEVHEVFGLDLAADLVVLSACETGLGSGALADVPPGDDWVGLTRAFLHAGVRQVMATLWPVDDWATAALMERFYEAYAAEATPSRALAAAQRAMLAVPATAHPFYWAGFTAVGGQTP